MGIGSGGVSFTTNSSAALRCHDNDAHRQQRRRAGRESPRRLAPEEYVGARLLFLIAP